MTKISTPYSFSLKIFPFLFLGVVAVILSMFWMGGAFKDAPIFIVVPGVMAAIGLVWLKVVAGQLVDEVYDCGDFLLVRKGSVEERVPLSNIINVNFAINQRPARITLTLDRPGRLGREISFTPPPKLYLSPFPKNDIAEQLIVRAHNARSER